MSLIPDLKTASVVNLLNTKDEIDEEIRRRCKQYITNQDYDFYKVEDLSFRPERRASIDFIAIDFVGEKDFTRGSFNLEIPVKRFDKDTIGAADAIR